MFFSEPTRAFSHMRKCLRPGGRCVFVCWRTPRDNAWTMTPLTAARAAMGVTPPPADPNAPGPYAFADDARLRAILADAGFASVDMRRFDAMLTLGETPRAAADGFMQIGPVSRFVREVGVEHAPTIRDAVERALAPAGRTRRPRAPRRLDVDRVGDEPLNEPDKRAQASYLNDSETRAR